MVKIVSEDGLTLVELLIAIAIFGLIAAGAAALLSVTFGAQAQGDARSNLFQEGLVIMERMTAEIRTTTLLHIPNAHQPVRTLVALSANVNQDGDNYFDDPMFPRIDEDHGGQYFSSGKGISGLDDNGNGAVDDTSYSADDDEDGDYLDIDDDL